MTLTGEARKEYAKQHYLNNKDKYRDRSQLRRTSRLKKLHTLKDNPCVDCGIKYHPYAMDFDHISDDKIANVSKLLNKSSWRAILEEIAKCELVCANCHRIRTYNRIYEQARGERYNKRANIS